MSATADVCLAENGKASFDRGWPCINGPEKIKLLPRSWVVERTFGWMVHWRWLVRDDEQRTDVSEAMIHIAMGSPLLRRIAHP
ncbi:transposase [Paraburkholderia sp. GAS448]